MNKSISENLTAINKKIKVIAEKAGRDPAEIRLMAVSKTKTKEAVLEAYQAGQRLFGENRVFEAEEKYADLPADIELHLIGHLQRNKAKNAGALVNWVDSIDKISTAEAIEKQCVKFDKTVNVLFEVNTSGEESKQGFRKEDDLWNTIDAVSALPHIEMRGLMTIAPLTDDKHAIRAAFARLRFLFEECKKRYPESRFDTLSMGMSSDYQIAIEEGSTMIRVGSLIFGRRD